MQVDRKVTGALKGFAIILVILYHGSGLLGVNNITAGQVGVELFIIASAYGLAVGAEKYRNKEITFLRRRFSVVYVPYAVALVGTFYFFGVSTYPEMFLHLVVLHGFTSNINGIDNSYWFMSFIFLAYIYVMVINRRFVELLQLPLGIGIFFVCAYAFWMVEPHSSHFVSRIPVFVLAYWVVRTQLIDNKLKRPVWAQAIDALTLCIFYLYALKFYPGIFSNAGVATILILVFAALVTLRWVATPLQFIGAYSFEIYLAHNPVMRAVLDSGLVGTRGVDANPALFAVVCIVLIAVMAGLLRLVTEGVMREFSIVSARLERHISLLGIRKSLAADEGIESPSRRAWKLDEDQ